MPIIILYAILLITVSLWMIIAPAHWTRWAVHYCRQPWMHLAEILICIGFGLPFITWGDASILPVLYKTLGYTLVIVGAALTVTPPSLHQRLGARVIERTGPWFRPGGGVTLVLGLLLLYSAVVSLDTQT